MKKINSSILLSFLLFIPYTKAQDIKLTNEKSIAEVVKTMTLEEKAKLVGGIGMGTTRIKGIAGGTFAIPRLGIPEIELADGPAGLRIGGVTVGSTSKEKFRFTTAFPIPTAMASSWDIEAMNQAAKLMGKECKEFGVDVLLAPAINIQRDPLGGRNFEYYTEDPFLNGRLAAAFIKGVQENGVGTSLKHYAANNTETLRQNSNEIISERALREIYLPGFEYAVKEAQPWTIMSAYPGVNGKWAAENAYLLREILRKEWGFKGMAMSDWGAVKTPAEGIKGGTDLSEPRPVDKAIVEAVNNGSLDVSVLDESVKNILCLVVKTSTFQNYNASLNPDITTNIPFVRKFASETMVLAKNDGNVLPIAVTKKIALFGNNAYNTIKGGGGSAEVVPAYTVSLTDGFKGAGYKLVSDEKKCSEGATIEDIKSAAMNSDFAVISIGRYSSEGSDKYSMEMLPEEVMMIKNISEVYHQLKKKVVMLLNIGAPLEIASWEKQVDAILITWQPGQEAGNAIADVVSGKVNPSGKLTQTFPVKYSDAPTFGNNIPKGKSIIYGEGIYVGYRYYDTRNVSPLYPFGFGLSYTSFAYSNLKVSAPEFDADKDVDITVTVDVKNIGKSKGKEIIQLYVKDNVSLLDRPMQELKGFGKIELAPDEVKTVSIKLDCRAFAYFNDNLNKWTIEPGSFEIRVGSSSRDIKATAKVTAKGGDAISYSTPWTFVQMNPAMTKVLTKYLGTEHMNDWYLFSTNRNEILGEVLRVNFERIYPNDKNNTDKLKEFKDRIIKEINEL
jgi:beta-glucosidase